MALIKVLPPSEKPPGVARMEGVTETRHRAKRESGGNISKTRHWSEEEEKTARVRNKKSEQRVDRLRPRSPLLINLAQLIHTSRYGHIPYKLLFKLGPWPM